MKIVKSLFPPARAFRGKASWSNGLRSGVVGTCVALTGGYVVTKIAQFGYGLLAAPAAAAGPAPRPE